jgi:hypothetical protein
LIGLETTQYIPSPNMLVAYSHGLSVAMVQTDVFRKNEIIVPSKFVKIVGIFDKIDDLENQGVI